MAGTSIGALTCRFSTRLPLFLLCRQMLETCRSVNDCRRTLETTGFSGAAHFAFADREGNLLGAEIIEGCPDIFHEPKNGVVYRTNHPLLPEGRRLTDEKANPDGLANSRKRMETLDLLLPGTPHTLAGMQSLLRSHHPHTSICQHCGTNGAVMNTDGSFIMLPGEGRMLALVGPACENEYEEFSL
jgi:hypothetical protein